MENFKLLKIEDSLKNSLEKMKFTKPTPIQAMAMTANHLMSLSSNHLKIS